MFIKDPNLKLIMQKYEADKETLKEIFNAIRFCAGQWVKGSYVATYSLAFGGTLDYLLRNRKKVESDDGIMEVCERLITYYKKGETGFIFD